MNSLTILHGDPEPVEILIYREHPFRKKPRDSETGRKRMNAYVLIPLYNRGRGIVAWARVDAVDASTVAAHRWRRTYYGYAITGTPSRGTQRLLHRLLLDLPNGDKRQGDHRNGDRLDNRRANLRIVTNAENAQNQAAKGGTSRYRGVSFRRDTGRWTGYVKVNYRRYGAGCFATEEEAVAAVRALRVRLMPFSEPAREEAA